MMIIGAECNLIRLINYFECNFHEYAHNLVQETVLFTANTCIIAQQRESLTIHHNCDISQEFWSIIQSITSK